MHSVRPPVSPNLSRRFPRLSEHVLLTGGAGFIGSHLADRLLAAGHRVRALDNLTPQVHGGTSRPEYLDEEVELVAGAVRDGGAGRPPLGGGDRGVPLGARAGARGREFE